MRVPELQPAIARLVVVACLLIGCSRSDRGSGPFPVANDGGLVSRTEESIRDFVLGGGTSDWVREPVPHRVLGLGISHGVVQTAFNDAYLAARHAERYPMPVGAAAVQESFNIDYSHKGWRMAIKVAEGNRDYTWLWWEADAPDYVASTYGDGHGRGAECDRCHVSGRDDSMTEPVP